MAQLICISALIPGRVRFVRRLSGVCSLLIIGVSLLSNQVSATPVPTYVYSIEWSEGTGSDPLPEPGLGAVIFTCPESSSGATVIEYAEGDPPASAESGTMTVTVETGYDCQPVIGTLLSHSDTDWHATVSYVEDQTPPPESTTTTTTEVSGSTVPGWATELVESSRSSAGSLRVLGMVSIAGTVFWVWSRLRSRA